MRARADCSKAGATLEIRGWLQGSLGLTYGKKYSFAEMAFVKCNDAE